MNLLIAKLTTKLQQAIQYKTDMILNRAMEKNTEPKDTTIHLWSVHFQTKAKSMAFKEKTVLSTSDSGKTAYSQAE